MKYSILAIQILTLCLLGWMSYKPKPEIGVIYRCSDEARKIVEVELRLCDKENLSITNCSTLYKESHCEPEYVVRHNNEVFRCLDIVGGPWFPLCAQFKRIKL